MYNIQKPEYCPYARKESVVQGENYRFSILTPFLIRLEYDPTGRFEDHATQVVLNRDFPVPDYEVIEENGCLELRTAGFLLTYYPDQGFTPSGLQIKAAGNYSLHHSVWHFGEIPEDLGGTARTLDNADGTIPLGHGIQSRNGWSLLEDTASLLLTEDGWVRRRPDGEKNDLYFFAYGHDYFGCLKDYYHLTGYPPLLPRYALGNWWSRYHRYTEAEYKALMERFEAEKIPFTVAVLDMDWHLTEVDPRYGTGWTGYTWNRDLFPHPDEFLSWLHEKGLKVTLNIHPADGVRPFEDCYSAMAKALGINPARKETIRFNITDQKVLAVWLEQVLHPLEKQGVDFWWIDWQQGTYSDVPGLDPLWILNHYCYLDHCRKKEGPLILSRYAGPGSHRYPVGFSGDTVISWKSLAFQPYFTAVAANIGYGWWSHDIGGHMNGIKDYELATRWIQFGAFSPIMRLHSSSSPFNSKEPWQYRPESCRIMKEFLRLRHRMLPYLYTMNRLSCRDGLPLVYPLYYRHPENWEAYEIPNEYFFGTQLIVCPITEPMDRSLGTAKFKGWLPEGIWYDVFTGMSYTGGRRIDFYRPLESIPVLARAGAIIPLSMEEGNSIENPKELELLVFAGESGSFHLYEDDANAGDEDRWVDTQLSFVWGKVSCFTVHPAVGNLAALPEQRTYSVVFTGLGNEAVPTVTVNRKLISFERDFDAKADKLRITVKNVPVQAELSILLKNSALAEHFPDAALFDFLNRAQISYSLKDAIYHCINQRMNGRDLPYILSDLKTMELPTELFGNLCEFLLR
ncbi:MAG TPA: alpha-xylosidase [Clostridiales bacterium]|nr:alpha-xylosidase [Clostridiales bacterium]